MNNGAKNDHREHWPDRDGAAAILGISVSGVRRKQAQGLLHAQFVGGKVRYDPAEVEQAAARGGGDDDDAGAEVLAAANALTKQAQGFVERLVSNVVDPSRQFVEVLMKEIAAQRVRISELEAKNSAMLEQAEKAMSLTHEREMQRLLYSGEEKRQEALSARKLRVLDTGIAALSKAAMKKFGLDLLGDASAAAQRATKATNGAATPTTAASERARPISKQDAEDSLLLIFSLVESLDDQRVSSLRAAGVVTDEQVSLIGKARTQDLDAIDALFATLDSAKLGALVDADVISNLQAYAIDVFKRSKKATP